MVYLLESCFTYSFYRKFLKLEALKLAFLGLFIYCSDS